MGDEIKVDTGVDFTMFVVLDDADRKALSENDNVRCGDIVHVVRDYSLYRVIDNTKLDSDDGYSFVGSTITSSGFPYGVPVDECTATTPVDLSDDEEECDECNSILNDFLNTFKIIKC